MSRQRISRRQFLGTTLKAAGVFTIVPRHVLGGPGYTPPSEVLTRAVIGTGGMGLNHVEPNVEGKPPITLAVCDVDQKHLAAGLEKAGPGCTGFSDFRRVLERGDIDTVHIATPPHWHALIGIAAAQAGKDILGEKPVSRSIREGRALIEAIHRYGRVFQVNTHFRFGTYYRFGAAKLLRKLVASGLLGSPLTVRVTRGQGFNWKVKEWSGRPNLTPEAVPAELDYDMWLGPAPTRPYHPHRVHQSFRGYWDYDGGGLSDMGQHYLDPVQYILGKDDTGPVEISAVAPWPTHPDAVGMWDTVTLKYADGDTILLKSGECGPPEEPGHGFIEGPRGRVYDNYRTEPAGLFDQLRYVPDPPPLLDFETAVRTRQQPGGNIDVAHRSCSLVNLANFAIRTGRTIHWDPAQQVVVGDEQANRLVDVPLRAPWHL
ncbi:MAG TPA: Gfo/Idh/MocA family oxidoreductase [Phycisphaerae bacterium]|nr:Gfo/Idh/MocA family oxidoreductase [Phycisphaerae bacterium]HNU45022.1 Gfo/Idh/MocA family oxidoreductase [Phycisphaerae bacterium]